MAANLEQFKTLADSYLQAEIDKREEEKVSIGGISFSAKQMASDATTKLITKGARGGSKSVGDHIKELTGDTRNFANTMFASAKGSMQNVLSVFDSSDNKIADSVTGTFRNILAGFSSDPNIVLHMAKRASKKTNKDARTRISLSSNITNTILSIRKARLKMSVPTLSRTPLESVGDAASSLKSAQSFLSIVLSGFEASQDVETTAKVTRRETSYNKSLEFMSDALDDLKIGSGQFALVEYMKLRLDLRVLIENFSKIDIDIQETADNFINAEAEYVEQKEKVGAIEGSYVKEVKAGLERISKRMDAVIKKDSENIALDSFVAWANDLLSVYTLAHSAFDNDIEAATTTTAPSETKQAYTEGRATMASIRPNIDAKPIVSKLLFLSDLYLVILRSETFTEAEVKEKEDEIMADLVTLSQSDQILVDIDNAYKPDVPKILGTILSLTKGTGLDKISNAILKGSTGDLFGLLTSTLGSESALAADFLKNALTESPDSHLQETLLKVNAKMQSIQRNKQIAGSVRENLSNEAVKAVSSDIDDLKSLKGQLEGIG